MNVVEFRLDPPAGDWAFGNVEILVDGVPLRDLAKVVEAPFAASEGHPGIAGAYEGLSERLCWPSRHFLGEPELRWFDEGETVLLGCDCGEWGCWPLTARVEVTGTTVVWSGFRNGHRDGQWDLSALGPFVFERGQYEAALRATQRDDGAR
ncbi:hypothetical protein AAH991_22420 [Microbispora sp. ZYX-F-249]|uniref:Uncharacterized protein n=1 Tax=Microbispora maris TaxID=3144104 RepID=A0ABV0AV76_9ACTN